MPSEGYNHNTPRGNLQEIPSESRTQRLPEAPEPHDYTDHPVLIWEAPEHEHIEKDPLWYWLTGGILLGIIIYALATNSVLMAITFILIGMLGYIYAEKEPRIIKLQVGPRGIIADNTMFEYEDLKSFWIFYEVEHRFKVISLHSQRFFLPHIHIPIGDANPIQIREILLYYLPEIRQETNLVDKLSRFIGY